jgi:hypothetical protein
MPKVTVDRLIEVLNDARDEVGGNCEVNLFFGGDYDNPTAAEDSHDVSVITNVMVVGVKSFMNSKSCCKLNEPDVKVWIKYE